ncbi:MAG: hypothetical protein ABJH98_17675 [Reichenbachiella sp.]|uniref:hypothetical protein n=1 Tax=Reichenbachiella sp. TaxID=2184521 RepID=UPI00326656BC
MKMLEISSGNRTYSLKPGDQVKAFIGQSLKQSKKLLSGTLTSIGEKKSTITMFNKNEIVLENSQIY